MAVSITWTKKGSTTATDITSHIEWDSPDIVSALTKERGTANFTILKTSLHSASIPSMGDDIRVYDDSGVFWGGTVTGIDTTVRKKNGGILLQAKVQAMDYGYILDSKLVKTSYANQDAADILADLVSKFGPAGITFDTTTYVQRGAIISSISFNYEPLTKCIQGLAQQIGWDWNVDPDKKIHFFFATTDTASSEYTPAPIIIDDTSGGLEWSTLDVNVQITNMKNSVYVIGGTYAKNFVDNPVAGANPPEYTPKDVYQTDGIRSVFPLAYRYNSSTINVTLNGVQQSTGIDQQENPAYYNVMYNTNGPFLVFPSPPASGQTLKIEGIAQVPIIVHMQNSTSINSYGEYQDSIIDSQITTVGEAQVRATADMTLYGHPVYDVRFSTVATGLQVGQVILLNSTLFGVSNYPLIIKRVEASSFSPKKFRYSVQAIGSDVVTMNDVMIGLIQQANQNNPVDPSTVIQIYQQAGSEALSLTDTATASGAAHVAFKWGSTATPSKWGFALWQ